MIGRANILGSDRSRIYSGLVHVHRRPAGGHAHRILRERAEIASRASCETDPRRRSPNLQRRSKGCWVCGLRVRDHLPLILLQGLVGDILRESVVLLPSLDIQAGI